MVKPVTERFFYFFEELHDHFFRASILHHSTDNTYRRRAMHLRFVKLEPLLNNACNVNGA